MKRLCELVTAILFVFISPLLALAGEAVLIEFASARCRPCQQMQPVISELSRAGIAVRTVDVDREPELAQRYGIQQTPTFIVVSSGKELTRLVGLQSPEQLRAALAINPSGPWVNTGSKPIDSPPQTRLAPLPTSMIPPGPNATASLSTIGEPMPSVSVADAIQHAQAATVRLKVHDGNGHGAGTGTIIDVHGEEALVLTCGHLFRDTKGQGRIEVDMFVGGETRTVDGQLIDYDSEDRDIALVAIRPGFPIQAVKVAGPNNLPVAGDAAFSFGCDRGADPSRRDTRITGVNKYNQQKGASNLEISGAPIDGRSGGGLFDSQGRLIGVCNAADYDGDVGIYAGPGSVQWQLDRVQLARLYQPDNININVNPAQSAPSAVALASGTSTPSFQPNSSSIATEPRPDRFASLGGPVALASAVSDLEPSASDEEVIVIVRSRSNPTASPRVMTLDRPTPALIQMLEANSIR